MDVISYRFLELMLATVLLYFIVPRKYQWCVILCGSMYFYASSGVKNTAFIVVTTLVSYFCALKISDLNREKKEKAKTVSSEEKKTINKEYNANMKMLLWMGIIFCVGTWVVLKYTNFIIANINAIFNGNISIANWIVPLGISFFTFHEVGYMIDIYRGRYEAERNFFKYLTFVAFFGHIVQGPFSRYNITGQSITEEHSFSYDRLTEGLSRILWGVFKKTVVADKLGISVATVFASYKDYSGTYLLFAILAYSIQIYADFSGYMDIMCGICHVLGIKLEENFRQPYFAKSVDEFWRRWHITLGAWFKDYVFYPLSIGKTGQKIGKWARGKFGTRVGKLMPGYFAMIFVWGATGLWHGANWTFLVWGYLNLTVIVFSMQMEPVYNKLKENLHINSDSVLWKLFSMVRTFFLVSFFRFFSTASSLHTALSMIKRFIIKFNFKDFLKPLDFMVNLTLPEIIFCAIGILFIIVVDVLCEKEKFEACKTKCPMLVRDLIYTCLIIAILLVAGGDNDLIKGFMYEQF